MATRPAVVVTGGSGGIGRAIATVAAREGGPIVLIARSATGLDEAAGEVRAAGGEPFCLPLDLLSAGAPDRVDAFLASHGLHCSVLVNNAGFGLLGRAHELSREDQLSLVDLNVRVLVDLTVRALPGMVARGSGGVINLGSVAAFVPGPGMALYFASKAFVRSFSAALSEEVRGTGVTVTCVAPGPVATGFFGRAGAKGARLFKMLPKLTAEAAAEQAWAGFRRGKPLVIPGPLARLAAFVARHVPDALLLPLLRRLLAHGRK